MWLTVSDFLWARFLIGLGFKANFTPVLTVIEGENCDAERLAVEGTWFNSARVMISPEILLMAMLESPVSPFVR